MTLSEFNTLTKEQATAALLQCCGSRNWAYKMTAQRPFLNKATFLETGEQVWISLSRLDWLEAFLQHPKIGDVKATDDGVAQEEQKSTLTASKDMLDRLAIENEAYFQRFGYLFIICASGKSAEELLCSMEERMHNEPAQELHIAAKEQAKITCLRLEKLIDEK